MLLYFGSAEVRLLVRVRSRLRSRARSRGKARFIGQNKSLRYLCARYDPLENAMSQNHKEPSALKSGHFALVMGGKGWDGSYALLYVNPEELLVQRTFILSGKIT